MTEDHLSTYTRFAPFYEQLLTDIKAARQYVHIQFFKYEADSVGQQLGSLLAQKVSEGVEARLMYDDFVCSPWKWYYRRLAGQGVQTAGFAPVHWPFVHPRDYYRNHRKVIVVDGRIAYTGGMNIAERYLRGLDWGCWRDTMVRIEGPAAADLQRAFAADWGQATGQPLAAPLQAPTLPAGTGRRVTIITSDPPDRQRRLMRHTVRLLDEAERYVWFESPYFIPTREVMQAMCRAARRGVDVRVLQPPRGDRGETTRWASKRHYGEALDAGVKIGTYRQGFLHSKIIVSDDRVGVVSSCNIDPRSYRLCYEVAAEVRDERYAATLRDIFLADEAQSAYTDPAEWRRRPLKDRLFEALAGVISSQL